MPSTHPTLAELATYAIIDIRGADATDFLQGQLSNDIQLLDKDSSHQLSAYCSPKGRILALFNIFKTKAGYILVAPKLTMEKVLSRLKMFVMRSDVEIESTTDLTLYGLISKPDAQVASYKKLRASGAQIFPHCIDATRAFVLADKAAKSAIEATRPPMLTSGQSNDWHTMNIEQNIPEVYIELVEALIPQSVNLDILGGVNFKKGCFPGQEIIARIKYRGKPKTRMISAEAPNDKQATIGAPIFIDERNSAAGNITNIVEKDDKALLSITLPVTHIELGALYLDKEKTMPLNRRQQAYEITL